MRIIGKITLAALALIALAAAAFWIWLPTDQILRIAADQVRAATGRELSVAGAARPSLWPDLGAEVAGVSLSNAPWADGPAMVTAEAAQISVAIWPLLSGDVQVTGLRLIRPNVSLEINADGQRNWDMAGNAAPGAARRIGIDRAEISDGILRLRDARTGRDIALSAFDGTLELPDMNAPMRLRASAVLNGKPAALTLDLGALSAALSGAATNAALTLTAAGATMSWDGMAAMGDALTLRGTLAAQSGAPGALLRDLGLGDVAAGLPPQLAAIDALSLSGDIDLGPEALTAVLTGLLTGHAAADGWDLAAEVRMSGAQGWQAGGPVDLDATLREGDAAARFTGTLGGDALFDGRMEASAPPRRIAALAGVAITLPDTQLQTASLIGALRITPKGGHLQGGYIRIDDVEAALTGDVDLTGARPAMRGALTLGAIDLRPWLAGGAPAPRDSWSTDPIGPVPRSAMDITLDFAAGPVTLPRGMIERIEGTATVKDATATLTVTKAAMFGGAMSGTARATPDKDGLRVTGELVAAGVLLRPALRALAGKGLLDGTGDLTAQFTAQGPHMDALMRSLAGKGAADLRDGAINGVNIPALVRNTLTGETGATAQTEFTRVRASWTIDKGVLHNDDLRMPGPQITLTGAGSVNIGTRRIDYRVTPRAVTAIPGLIDAGGLSFPVTVRGPWRAPTIAPDLARAIPGLLGAVGGAVGGAAKGGATILEQGLGAIFGAPKADEKTAPPETPLNTLKGLFRQFQ